MTKGTERMSSEAGPGILIFPFLVQRVTGPNRSEVGEEGNIGTRRGAGGFGLLSLDVCVSTDGGYYFRMEHGWMYLHVHLIEISKCFHMPETSSPRCASLPAVCVEVAGSWLSLPGK